MLSFQEEEVQNGSYKWDHCKIPDSSTNHVGIRWLLWGHYQSGTHADFPTGTGNPWPGRLPWEWQYEPHEGPWIHPHNIPAPVQPTQTLSLICDIQYLPHFYLQYFHLFILFFTKSKEVADEFTHTVFILIYSFCIFCWSKDCWLLMIWSFYLIQCR